MPRAFAVPAAFFPGRPVTSPTTFSNPPTTASATFSVFVRGFFTVLTFAPVTTFFFRVPVGVVAVVPALLRLGFATRPVVALERRGFEVFALGAEVVVRFLGATAVAICVMMRGLLLPVLARVEAAIL